MEDFLEGIFPTVSIKQRSIGGCLESEEQPDREKHYRRQPDAKKHIHVAIHRHAFTNGGDDIINNEKQHRDDHRQAQTALADNSSQRRADEEEDEACDAQGELLVPFLLVLLDVLLVALEINLVERDIVLGIAG